MYRPTILARAQLVSESALHFSRRKKLGGEVLCRILREIRVQLERRVALAESCIKFPFSSLPRTVYVLER